MSLWPFTAYMDAVIKVGKMGKGEEGREWIFSDLYVVLCGESEEELKVMVGRFAEVRRRGLKVNTGKSKMMVLGGEERLECEVCVDEKRLGHVWEFKFRMSFGLMKYR